MIDVFQHKEEMLKVALCWLLFVEKGNNLDLSELFDPVTFRATAANLVYVLRSLYLILPYITLPVGWMPVIKQTPSADATRWAKCITLVDLFVHVNVNIKYLTRHHR